MGKAGSERGPSPATEMVVTGAVVAVGLAVVAVVVVVVVVVAMEAVAVAVRRPCMQRGQAILGGYG